jgi:hypothetical protein
MKKINRLLNSYSKNWDEFDDRKFERSVSFLNKKIRKNKIGRDIN